MQHSGLTALQTLGVLAAYNPEIKAVLDKVNAGKLTPIAGLRKARQIEKKATEKK